MSLAKFVAATRLIERPVAEMASLLAFYRLKSYGVAEFTAEDARLWLLEAHVRTGLEALGRALGRSRRFIRGSAKGTFRLEARTLSKLDAVFPELATTLEDVDVGKGVIPRTVYVGAKSYIVKLCKEVNACYEQGIYFGCALLMRKLMEVLLREALRKSASEQGSGEPWRLGDLVDEGCRTLELLRWRAVLDRVRIWGNYTAHLGELTIGKSDIDGVNLMEYRVAVEQLMYKAGAKT